MFARHSAFSTTLCALILTAPLVLSSPALAQKKGDNKGRPATVVVNPVIEESTRQTVPVLGRLVAQNSGVVSALIKGVVADMRVHVGDRVKAGDVIAVLAPNALKWLRDLRAAQIKSAEADLANARAQATLRRQELARLENLRKSSAFSPARFEDATQELAKAESGAARAQSDVAVAKANLNLADIDLANAHVKAP